MSGNSVECPFCRATICPPPLPAGAVCTCPKCQKPFRLSEAKAAEAEPQKVVSVPVTPAKQDDILVVCFRCGTRVYAAPEHLGKAVRCPDCHSMNTVKRPTGMAPTPAERTQAHDDDDHYRMSEPEARPAASMAGLVDSQESNDIVVRDPEQIQKSTVRLPTYEELDREKRYEDDWSDETVEREIRPFVSGIINFMFFPEAIFRWVLLGLGAAAVSYLAHRAWIDMNAGGIYFFLALGETLATIIFGVIVVVPIAVCCLRIVADTANGQDRVENWPDLLFLEWVSESVFWIAGLLWGAAPGIILCALLSTTDLTLQFWVIPSAIGIWLLLPVMLLSMLEENSIIAIYSPRIVSTLAKSMDSVFIFYIQTALVAFGIFVAVWLQWGEDDLMPSAAAFAMVALSFIYSRLLGRLMLVCEIKRFNASARVADEKPLAKPVDSPSSPPIPASPPPPPRPPLKPGTLPPGSALFVKPAAVEQPPKANSNDLFN